MKPATSKAIYDDCKKRGYVLHGNVLYPPGQAKEKNITPTVRKNRIVHIKTGWTDDTRNIRNKEKQNDVFMRLVEVELGLQAWPEFIFLVDRAYRFDYAIPDYKIAVEQDGGIHRKGGGAHSRPANILRDIEKNTLAAVNGWILIRRTPQNLPSAETIELIKTAIKQR